MKNIVPLFPNLSRAYEIALLGNFSISVVFEEDYEEGFEDYKTIKEFFGETFFSADGDICCEIFKPTGKVSPKSETLIDILNRVNQSRNNPLPSEFKSDSGLVLLNTAIEKLNLPLAQQEKVVEVAKVIAQLDNEPKIEAHHIAEAINYMHQFADKDRKCNAEEQSISFGNGITIAKHNINPSDAKNAIEYLKSLFPEI